MHRVLYLIVRAENAKEAIDEATTTFENELKTDDRTTYDYCKPMEGSHNVAGSDRWTAFEGEPLAAPIHSEQAKDWIDHGLTDTKDNFIGHLYRFLANSQQALEESVETAPEALTELVEYARENPELPRQDAISELREDYSRTLNALFDGDNLQHRYNAASLSEGNLMEGHVINCYTYQTPSVADGSYRTERVQELLDWGADDAYVVPLDAHF